MVNPGSFFGSRKEFITAQKDLYACAVVENHVADTVADVQRRYFKCYPITLLHTEEPSASWLAQVDDNSPDADLQPPNKLDIDDEAFEVAQAVYVDQVKLLKFRKDQIARRLSYQYSKDHKPIKHIVVGSEDPMAVLMAKLAGIPIKKPRIRTASTVFAQSNQEFVDAIYEKRVNNEGVPSNRRAALRMQVYKDCFNELDEEEQKEYEARAVEEHRVALEKVERALNAPPSESPADRQQVLKNLPSFVQPILDLISDYTGWKATLLLGGPEPADQGRLNMMSFHSGETVGNIKMNFGQSERRAYKKFVMPIYGAFLKKCYTVEDCRAAAISDTTSASLAETLELDGGDFSIDSVDDCIAYVKVARLRETSGEFDEPDAGTPLPPSLPEGHPVQTATMPPLNTFRESTMASPVIQQAMSHPRNPGDGSSSSTQQPSVLSLAASPCHSIVPSPAPSPSLSIVSLPLPAPSPHRSIMPLPSPFIHQSLTPSPDTRATAASTVQNPASLQTARRSSKRHQPDSCSEAANSHPIRKRLRSSKDTGVDGAPMRGAISAEAPSGISRLVESSMPDTERVPPLTPKDLAECPDWFLKAYQMLLSKDPEPSWVNLVRAWAHFEKESHYQEAEKLGSAGRPPCISAWIARARSPTYRPKLGALPVLEKSFGTWWANLQPEWRRDGLNGPLKRQPGNLDELRRPGKNGLLSVLAALFFWGVYAADEGSVGWKRQWKCAVDDVYWVISSLRST